MISMRHIIYVTCIICMIRIIRNSSIILSFPVNAIIGRAEQPLAAGGPGRGMKIPPVMNTSRRDSSRSSLGREECPPDTGGIVAPSLWSGSHTVIPLTDTLSRITDVIARWNRTNPVQSCPCRGPKPRYTYVYRGFYGGPRSM